MDDQRVGRVVRALRRRQGWRQQDLGAKAKCSQNLISLIERGHMDLVSLRVLRRVLAALDASAVVEIRWRGAALERLLDEGHALLVGAVAEWLRSAGWRVELDVTYSEFGERGSIDIFAFHPDGSVLVVEIKTDVPSAEATIRKLDEKARLAADVARKRFGWRGKAVARLLVLPESSTLRARVTRHRLVFEQAFPSRNLAIKEWLTTPSGAISGLWFFSSRDPRVAKSARTGGQRVRLPKASPNKHDQAA